MRRTDCRGPRMEAGRSVVIVKMVKSGWIYSEDNL